MKCLLVTRFRSHSTAISAVRVSGSSRICSSTAPFTLDLLRMPVPTAERLAGRNLLLLNSLNYEFVFQAERKPEEAFEDAREYEGRTGRCLETVC